MTDASVQTDADGVPLGPIRLPAPIPSILIEKANGIEAASKAGGADAIPTILKLMAEINTVLEPMIENYVAVMRAWNEPWSDVARALGVSKQAAWERYRHVDGKVPRSVVPARSST